MASFLGQRRRTDRAFERLYERHVADVYHYALAVLRHPADAEDVTQTTFLNAYRAFSRGESPRSPQNWLIAIAHNVCRQRFRQSARRPSEVALDEELVESFVDDDVPSASDIRTALGHLAFNQRAALVMRELEGRSYAEIAEILELSVGAVETLIFRARRALREQLEGALTCHQAELAVSRQIDGRLPRAERGALRAHLRECAECATFARSQRAQRAALRSLAAVPVPGSLASFFGGAGGSAAGLGAGLAVKAAVAVSAAAVVGGVGYEGATHLRSSGGGRPVVTRDAEPRSDAAPAPVAAPAPPAAVRPARAQPDPATRAKQRQVSPSKPGRRLGQIKQQDATSALVGGATDSSRPGRRIGWQRSRSHGRAAAAGHPRGKGSSGSSGSSGQSGGGREASPGKGGGSKPKPSHGPKLPKPPHEPPAPAVPVPPVPVPPVPSAGKIKLK